MKKLLFILALTCCSFWGIAQEKFNAEEAKAFTANIMANFTESVSFAYNKGESFDEFRTRLCCIAVPDDAGNALLETAYHYLANGVSKEEIIKVNDGKAVASAMQYLANLHEKEIQSDGSELFGGKDVQKHFSDAKATGCKWYQFWCLVQDFANWVILNWPIIHEIVVVVFSNP